MANPVFGHSVTHDEGEAYFNRYIDMKKRWGADLNEFLKSDPEAQRFFCGRLGQPPENEDWAYIFDRDSTNRLKTLLNNPLFDSLVIFQGIRDLEAGDPAGESNGRPTLLAFPSKFVDVPGTDGKFDIGDVGEEHPGSGGGNGIVIPPILPKTLTHFHEIR